MVQTLLHIVFSALAVAVAFVLNGYFWGWLYRTTTEQDETLYFRTRDGWRLALHHYRASGNMSGLPVILCHGMGANRYVFDTSPAPSLARFLTRHGRDVWVPELRGSGMSDRPGLFYSDVPYAWGFDDHVIHDVPAIIGEVRRRTGAASVHWIGHSMGGMLIEAHLASQKEPPVASAVALGAPVDFSKMSIVILRILARLRWSLKLTPLPPMPFNGRLILPVAHKLPRWLIGLFNPPNVDASVSRRIVALCSELITSKKLWLDMGRFVDRGTFAPENGKPYLEGLPGSTVPLLIVGGSQDRVAPPDTVIPASSAEQGPYKGRCLILGKKTGCVEDYGHLDLMVGLRSEQEVFPILLAWLTEQDPAVESSEGRCESKEPIELPDEARTGEPSQ